MDVYWEVVQTGVGVKSIEVEFQKPEKESLFNTILISLGNDIMIRMTVGEWQNIGQEIGKQMESHFRPNKEQMNIDYGVFGSAPEPAHDEPVEKKNGS